MTVRTYIEYPLRTRRTCHFTTCSASSLLSRRYLPYGPGCKNRYGPFDLNGLLRVRLTMLHTRTAIGTYILSFRFDLRGIRRPGCGSLASGAGADGSAVCITAALSRANGTTYSSYLRSFADRGPSRIPILSRASVTQPTKPPVLPADWPRTTRSGTSALARRSYSRLRVGYGRYS